MRTTSSLGSMCGLVFWCLMSIFLFGLSIWGMTTGRSEFLSMPGIGLILLACFVLVCAGGASLIFYREERKKDKEEENLRRQPQQYEEQSLSPNQK